MSQQYGGPQQCGGPEQYGGAQQWGQQPPSPQDGQGRWEPQGQPSAPQQYGAPQQASWQPQGPGTPYAQVPPAGPGGTIDLTLQGGRKAGYFVAMVLLVVMGGAGLWGGIGNHEVLGIVISAFALLLGVLLAVLAPRVLARRQLVLTPQGLDLQDPSRPVQLDWREFARVEVAVATKLQRYSRSTLVALDLAPADPAGFEARHPGVMRTFMAVGHQGELSIPLGQGNPRANEARQLLESLRLPNYAGVTDDGIAWGLRYS